MLSENEKMESHKDTNCRKRELFVAALEILNEREKEIERYEEDEQAKCNHFFRVSGRPCLRCGWMP